MDKVLAKAVIDNEYSLLRLFCDETLGDNYIRFCDNGIIDMWDHNFTLVLGDFDPEDLKAIKAFKEERKESHIKIELYKQTNILEVLGYKHTTLLTMAAYKLEDKPLLVPSIAFKNLKDNPEIVNDILETETQYYGAIYGNSFIGRKLYRYFNKVRENTGLNYFCCYINNKLVGYCETYFSNGVVALDGLLVVEEYRNKHIASNLVSYVQKHHNCPIYLHVDKSESVKDVYASLGFETVCEIHEYLKLDEDEKID